MSVRFFFLFRFFLSLPNLFNLIMPHTEKTVVILKKKLNTSTCHDNQL